VSGWDFAHSARLVLRPKRSIAGRSTAWLDHGPSALDEPVTKDDGLEFAVADGPLELKGKAARRTWVETPKQ
jgi:hypothetical protein